MKTNLSCCWLLAATLVVSHPPLSSADPVPTTSTSLAELQAQIQSLRQSAQSMQSQIAVGLRLGTITPAQLVPMAQQVQQIQAQRVALEQQLPALTAQQTTGGSGSSFASTTTTFGSGSGSGSPTPAPLPSSALAGLTPAQQTLVAAKQSLQAQVQAVQQRNPGNGQALVNLLTQWQSQNSDLLAQAQQDAATASAANRPQALARLLAQQAQGISLTAAPNLPPKMQALVQQRQTAARALQIIVLQSETLSPADYQAALANWQSTYGPTLGQMTADATAETQAIGAATAARMLNPSLPSNAP